MLISLPEQRNHSDSYQPYTPNTKLSVYVVSLIRIDFIVSVPGIRLAGPVHQWHDGTRRHKPIQLDFRVLLGMGFYCKIASILLDASICARCEAKDVKYRAECAQMTTLVRSVETSARRADEELSCRRLASRLHQCYTFCPSLSFQ